jgi:tetratricopeptide (TPR) repeat protein
MPGRAPSGIDAAFAAARNHHKAGRLAEAEHLYRQILAAHPSHVGSLHLLGLVAEQSGRHQAAVDLIGKAVALDGGIPVFHYHLASALQSLGRLNEAAASYRKAIALRPDYLEAHNNLGLALKDQGRPDEAVSSFGQALRLNPNLASIHYNLGMARRAQGRLDDAIACFRKAVTLEPKFVDAHNNLAIVLKESGDATEAAACYRAILALRPDYPEARANLGHALRDQGRFDDAILTYQQAIASGQDVALAYHGLSVCRKFTEADQPLIAAMRSALDTVKLSDSERSLLHFALGKAFDDLRDYGTAMDHFDAGNGIDSQTRDFDADGFTALVDSLIAAFPIRGPVPATTTPSGSDLPVLIVGMPRSGTTLVEQILASHPQVAAGGELDFWLRRLDAIRRRRVSRLDTALEQEAIRDYPQRLRRYSSSATRVTDKMPFNFLFLGHIHRLFPNARIIHCRRDPVDTALSIYVTRFAGTHDFACRRADIVRYIQDYRRLMEHWRAVLPPDRLLDIDYEDVVADPAAASRRLVAFCGLDWDDTCLDFHDTDRSIVTASAWQARQPVYRGSAQRWRNYEPWLGALDQLRSLGT